MNQNRQTPFRWVAFSRKQKQLLTWWMDGSPVKDKDGIICDGSVRAGKTLVMSFAFVLWAMESFSFQNFIMAGKTIGAFRRNVLFLLKVILRLRGYKIQDKRSDNLIIVRRRKTGVINYFYVFGGKDEASQDLVQGLTAAGLFLDEVTLMPESFVNQAIARCSVDGAKLWFNCNPDGPYHWFKVEFVDQLDDKNLIRIHFTMDDNPSLTEETKERYRRMFSGIFFKRYILGLWVIAEGIIYDMFMPARHVVKTIERQYSKYYISIDYGTYNPFAMGLYGYCPKDKKWYKVDEYYYDGRLESRQKTDEEYYEDLLKFVGLLPIKTLIIDPSAASFITLVNKRGKFKVRKANNSVLDGIRNVATALEKDMILHNDRCEHTIKEFASYIWDSKSIKLGDDKPLKLNDHCMDEERYFIHTIVFNGSTFSWPGRGK